MGGDVKDISNQILVLQISVTVFFLFTLAMILLTRRKP